MVFIVIFSIWFLFIPLWCRTGPEETFTSVIKDYAARDDFDKGGVKNSDKDFLQQGRLLKRNDDIQHSSAKKLPEPQKKPITSMQKIALVESPAVENSEEVGLRGVSSDNAASDQYFKLTNESLLTNNYDQRVMQFFTNDVWDDTTFQKSLLIEYKNFFEKKLGKELDDQNEEYVLRTKSFREVYKDFKTYYQNSLQAELNNYSKMVKDFITYISHQDTFKFQSEYPVLKIEKVDKLELIDDIPTFYVLTYEGYRGKPQYVSEKSIRLLCGNSFLSAFTAKEKRGQVSDIIIPYKNGLDKLSDMTEPFSLLLLRKQISYK